MDWLTNLFKGLGSAAQGAGQSIGQGLGSVAKGVGNAVQPMLSQAAPMLGNLFKGSSQQTQNPTQGINIGQQKSPGVNLSPGQPNSGGNSLGGIMSMFSGLMGGQGNQKTQSPSTQNPMQPQNTNSLIGSNNNFSSWLNNLFQPTQQTQPQQTQVQTPTATSQPAQSGGPMGWLGSLFSPQPGQPNMGQALLGGGLGLAGQMMNTPKMPDINGMASVNAFKNFDMTKNTQTLSPGLLKAFQDQTALRDQQEQKALYARYANLQPGTSPEESSTFKTDLNNLNLQQSQRAADELSQLYAQNAATQMGLNEQESQQMQQVAQLDVDQIMNQFGIDYANAMKLKEMFGNMGGEMVSSAFGAFNPVSPTNTGGTQ